MSSVSVVQYSNSSSAHKLNVLQQNTNSNNNDRREVIVLRKPPHILPQPKDYCKEDVLLTNTAKKKQKTNKEVNKTNPQPVAVARRNARERNRVKQVNNGFANLRQHIPNFIAAAFESNSGKGGNKKLSKVETLRMAVEYIRSLEDILAMDGNGEIPENSSSRSISSFPSPTPSSPTLTNQSNLTYNYTLMSPSADEDDMSTSPPPQQYIRINTTNNTYQIIPNTTNMFENSENLDPLVDDHIILSDPSLMDPNLDFAVGQDLSYLNNIQTTASLSPGMYSEQSLSPSSIEKSDPNCFIPVFNTSSQDIKIRLSPVSDKTVVGIHDLPVLSLKTENELPEEQKGNVIDVIQWWEQQQPSHNPS